MPPGSPVETGSESWTYGELQQASAAIAGEIARQQPQETLRRPVAIYARRRSKSGRGDPWVLRSGHPFLILDPKHPAARNQRCLQLAQPVGLLSLLPISEIPRILRRKFLRTGKTFMLDLSAEKMAYCPGNPKVMVERKSFLVIRSGRKIRCIGHSLPVPRGRHAPLSAVSDRWLIF